jgi:hypothetical protein
MGKCRDRMALDSDEVNRRPGQPECWLLVTSQPPGPVTLSHRQLEHGIEPLSSNSSCGYNVVSREASKSRQILLGLRLGLGKPRVSVLGNFFEENEVTQ